MSRHVLRAVSLTAGCCLIALAGSLPAADAAPGPQASLRAAEHARIVEHWTPERRAAAIPRDFVLDAQGRAFLKLPGGALQPYGSGHSAMAKPVPAAKPGGGGGGGDTEAPAIDAGSMNPASGAKIGGSYTFSAVVTDNVALRSVSFKVQKGSGRAQSFSATLGTNDTWTVPLQGFSDGAWSWWVEAKDTANLASVSQTVNFTVDTAGGGGGGGGGGGDTVTNAHWTTESAIKDAVGRIYFEMPSNARWTRWAGYVCSGTVMKDGASGRSVIITAAHCVYDDANKAFARNVMFIPDQDGTTGAGTDRNCSNDPIGCWTTSFGVVDVNWTTSTFPDNIPWDYAYYVVSDSASSYTPGLATTSATLDVAAGAMTVNFGPVAVDDGTAGIGSTDFTWALGYSYSDDPDFMYCAEDMTTEGTANWWLPSCGLSGGSSGGSWLQKITGSKSDGSDIGDTGAIMSVNSWGYTTSPGMAGPKLDRNQSSAECVFLTGAKVLGLALESEAQGRQGAAVICP